MILLGLLSVIFECLKLLFSWLSLPDMPEEITNVIDQVIQYVVDGLPILWLFFDKSFVIVCLMLVLACYNFEKIYDFLLWLLKKLPLGIE